MKSSYIKCKNADEAYAKAPWAEVAVKTSHGYRMFGSHREYSQWEENKVEEQADDEKKIKPQNR